MQLIFYVLTLAIIGGLMKWMGASRAPARRKVEPQAV
jgi:hypothetical protein